MDLNMIRIMCWKNDCVDCPFYDSSTIIGPEGPFEIDECLFHNIPQQWNVKEIERRLEDYGKKEKS